MAVTYCPWPLSSALLPENPLLRSVGSAAVSMRYTERPRQPTQGRSRSCAPILAQGSIPHTSSGTWSCRLACRSASIIQSVQCPDRLRVRFATERIDWPVTPAREISSRSAKVSANLERRREAGRIPPVLERIPCTVEWFRSKSWAICCSESPFCQRSHIKAFWLSE